MMMATMIKKWTSICLFLLSANIYSQAIDDFGTWWGIEVRKTFLTDFRASFAFETRLNQNSSNVKNVFINPALRYAPLKWLYVGTGYRFDNRYQQADRYFTQRHRVNLDLGFVYEIKRFEFEYRNRFQLQWEDYYSNKVEYPLMFSRHQLAASFKWPQLPFTSSVSGELWLPVIQNTELSKFRFILCQEYRLQKLHRFQLRFVFQTDLSTPEPIRDYIISTRYIFSF